MNFNLPQRGGNISTRSGNLAIMMRGISYLLCDDDDDDDDDDYDDYDDDDDVMMILPSSS